jgi:hypothetical protein
VPNADAASAGVAGPDGHQHPELGGHDVEPFSFVLADAPHLLAAARTATVGKVQHLLNPLEVCRQVAAVATPLGARLVVTWRLIVVARRRWSRRCRPESQGQLPGVDPLGTLAEAVPAQVVDNLLERRDARLSRGERGAQLRDLLRCITAAAGTIVWHAGIVADLRASGQAKAARCGITLP